MHGFRELCRLVWICALPFFLCGARTAFVPYPSSENRGLKRARPFLSELNAFDEWDPPVTVSSLKSAEADPSYAATDFMKEFDDTDSQDNTADSSEVYDVSWDGPTAADYQKASGSDEVTGRPAGPISRDLTAGASTGLAVSPPAASPAVAARGRESGYMGDSSLRQIADDYGAPLCYLADVVMDWGAPYPILPDAKLGDLVTGEQAYAVVEAVNSLDMHAVSERYESKTLVRTAEEYGIALADAFGFCVREGYNLPFGVHTVLRVVQCQEMLDALCDDCGEEDGGWDGELDQGEEREVIDYQDMRQEEFF